MDCLDDELLFAELLLLEVLPDELLVEELLEELLLLDPPEEDELLLAEPDLAALPEVPLFDAVLFAVEPPLEEEPEVDFFVVDDLVEAEDLAVEADDCAFSPSATAASSVLFS